MITSDDRTLHLRPTADKSKLGCKDLPNSNAERMTYGIDQFISVARVLLYLFDTAGAAALKRDCYLYLSVRSK